MPLNIPFITVNNISTRTGLVSTSGGNSNQWNSTFTTLCANSATWVKFQPLVYNADNVSDVYVNGQRFFVIVSGLIYQYVPPNSLGYYIERKDKGEGYRWYYGENNNSEDGYFDYTSSTNDAVYPWLATWVGISILKAPSEDRILPKPLSSIDQFGSTLYFEGTSVFAAKADHSHVYPTAVQIGAAPTVHTHTISQITNLQTTLNNKLNVSAVPDTIWRFQDDSISGFLPNVGSIIPVNGNNNIIKSDYSIVNAGQNNLIFNNQGIPEFLGFYGYGPSGYVYGSIIAGGNNNNIGANSSNTIVYDSENDFYTGNVFYANIYNSSILGGLYNTISAVNLAQVPYSTTTANYNTIVGGVSGLIYNGDYSFIGGGRRNTVYGNYNNILGGQNNTLSGTNSFILGSNISVSANNFTFVNNLSSQGIVAAQGGNSTQWNSTFTSWNAASATSVVAFNDTRFARLSSQAYTLVNATSSIQPVRGIGNTASGNYSLVAGGQCNRATGPYSTVVGGISSLASGNCSFIGGGQCNIASSDYSFVGGGFCNTTSGFYSTVASGQCNRATGTFSTVAGGQRNCASGTSSTVAGGSMNTATMTILGYTTVGGGQCNTASGVGYSTVAGGICNTASGPNSTIGGGGCNTASGSYSTVAGGQCNRASGACSFIAGGFRNDTRSFANTFILGSSLSAVQANTTYVNNLSSQGIVNALGGDSNQWNSSFTTTQANTATDSFDLSYVGTLPTPRIPIHTTTPLRDALLGVSGFQAATLRNGKWIASLSITGLNNPTIDNLISLSSSDIVGIIDSFTLSNLSRLSAVSFPSLASVGLTFSLGGLASNSNALTTISFPSLASVGGAFIVLGGFASGMNSLATISFPSLASVGGTFGINSNGSSMNSLTAVSFPSLASVGGNFTCVSGPINSIITVSFPSLASVGGSFTFNQGSSMNSLTAVSFPSLSSVAGGLLFNNQGTTNVLTTISFPSLASVGSNIQINSVGTSFINSITNVSFPSLASVGASFAINGNTANSMNSFTTLLIGSGLKHINGDFTSGNVGLDRHNAWTANTYYPSFTSFTAPASAFSSTTTGTTCTVNIVGHGLQTNDIITVSGITGSSAANHNFNAVAVPVTRINADQFSYTITATTQIPIGRALIQRQEVTVTPITKNGRKYICTGAGTSGGSQPTWPTTIGNTVVDGTVTWTCSEMSLPNILSRLDALSGTNQTITYGANRFINITPATLITVNSISTTAGVATITTATNHGITTGTQVVISGCTGTALRYNGVWTVTSTGLTTLTTPVPTDLNGVAGAGTMRLTNASPQFTGIAPIAATTVTGISADSHMISSGTQLRDSDSGTGLPIFVAGIYNRNGTTNGFARYSCTENGWDIWYDTTSKRWVNSPSQFTGNAATVGDYAHTPQSVTLASTSAANPAGITSSVPHGVATGAVFTVVIEGCSNAALNGSWTATSTGATTFTIPVNGSGGATTNSGTVSVLNQNFNQGILMSATVASPIQGVQQTITTGSNHGFTTGDFIHVYGAVGTHETSINDLNTSATVKRVTSAITVIDATSFRFVRYSNTQPFIGSYSLTTMPHMRDPSINDTAFYTALKLRARGLAVSLHGTTGL